MGKRSNESKSYRNDKEAVLWGRRSWESEEKMIMFEKNYRERVREERRRKKLGTIADICWISQGDNIRILETRKWWWPKEKSSWPLTDKERGEKNSEREKKQKREKETSRGEERKRNQKRGRKRNITGEDFTWAQKKELKKGVEKKEWQSKEQQ